MTVIIINGKQVYPPEGGRTAKGKGAGDESAKAQLQARYPGVIFRGDCRKIVIDSGVKIGAGAQITQTGEKEMCIKGSSTIGRNVKLATGSEAAGDGSVVTVDVHQSAGSIRVQKDSCVIISSGSGNRIHVGTGTGGRPSRFILNNVTLEDGAVIEGANIALTGTTVKSNGRITFVGSRTFSR